VFSVSRCGRETEIPDHISHTDMQPSDGVFAKARIHVNKERVLVVKIIKPRPLPREHFASEVGNVSSRNSSGGNYSETMEPQVGQLEGIGTARSGVESPNPTVATRTREPEAFPLSWDERNRGL
jgi:hypothetical protein